jgi:hypothetical protein
MELEIDALRDPDELSKALDALAEFENEHEQFSY